MKIFKIVLSLLAVFIFTLGDFSKAKASSDFINLQKELIAEAEKELNIDIQVDVLTDEEINYVADKLSYINEYGVLHEKIKEQNFKKVDVPVYETSYKYTNLDANEAVYMTSEVYENEDKIIVTFVQYNEYNDEIGIFIAEERDKTDLNALPVEIISYINVDNDFENNKDIMMYKSFNFNGKAFACGMTGFLACVQYCGVWGLATGPVGGGVCSAICNTAFVAACSFA